MQKSMNHMHLLWVNQIQLVVPHKVLKLLGQIVSGLWYQITLLEVLKEWEYTPDIVVPKKLEVELDIYIRDYKVLVLKENKVLLVDAKLEVEIMVLRIGPPSSKITSNYPSKLSSSFLSSHDVSYIKNQDNTFRQSELLLGR